MEAPFHHDGREETAETISRSNNRLPLSNISTNMNEQASEDFEEQRFKWKPHNPQLSSRRPSSPPIRNAPKINKGEPGDPCTDKLTNTKHETTTRSHPESDNQARTLSHPHSPPQTESILRVAAWNVNGSISTVALQRILIEGDIQYLSISEPHPAAQKDTTRGDALIKKGLQDIGFEVLITPHNIVAIHQNTIGRLIEGQPTIILDGRAIFHVFEITSGEYIVICSIYGITGYGSGKYKDGSDKQMLRKQLADACLDKIRTLRWRLKNVGFVLIGDMNQTIGPQQYMQSKFNPLEKNGILRRSLEAGFRIPLLERTSEEEWTHISSWRGTRRTQGKNTTCSSTIDWVLCDDTTCLMERRTNLDWNFTKQIAASDHALIFVDLALDITSDSENDEYQIKRDYRKIEQIRIRRTQRHEDDSETAPLYEFDDRQFPSRVVREDEERLVKLRDIAVKREHHAKLKQMEKSIASLQTKMIQHAQNHAAQDWHKGRLLPPRLKQHTVEIDVIMEELYDACNAIMNDLKLSRKISIGQQIRRRKRMIQEKGRPDHLAQLRTPRHISAALSDLESWKAWVNDTKHCNENGMDIKDLRAALEDIRRESVGLETISEAAERARIDVDEFEQHVKSIEQHRPTNREAREKERAELWGALHEEDCDEMRCILKDNGCSDTLRFSPEWQRGIFNVDPEEWTILPQIIDEIPDDELHLSLQEAGNRVVKLENYIFRMLVAHRRARLMEASRSGKMGDVTSILRHKSRELPEGQHTILDPETGVERSCRSNIEILEGTRQEHQRWMDTSKAKTQCLFMSVKQDEVGDCGLDIHIPDHDMTDAELKDLIFLPERCTNEEIIRFREAHDAPHIRGVISNMQGEPADELQWKFRIDTSNASFIDDGVEEEFWRAIEGVPGKARHNGLHMAFFARLPIEWPKLLFRVLRAALITRHYPAITKHLTRIPIPKPNSWGETRPIALLDDVFCWITSVVCKRLVAGIEAIDALPNELIAYRKGMGTDDATLRIRAANEDAIESGQMSADIEEDEEKYFDRIITESHLCGLIHVRCPPQGYVELKADDMQGKHVQIVIRQGVAHARFRCGQPQGSLFSVSVANLVAKLKYNAWSVDRDPAIMRARKLRDPTLQPYQFATTDTLSKTESTCLFAVGYSDDNKRFFGVRPRATLEELDWAERKQILIHLIERIQDAIDNTGDFSLVFKLGRKGAKSTVSLYNIEASMIDYIPTHFKSIAWSFEHDRPITENIAVRIHIRPNEHCLRWSLRPGMILGDEQHINIMQRAAERQHGGADRHMGITSTIDGNTRATAQGMMKSLMLRTEQILRFRMDTKAIRFAINALIVSVASYAPLLSGLSMKEILRHDAGIANNIRRGLGLTRSDAQELIYASPRVNGIGIKSLAASHLTALARELEVHLNSDGLTGDAVRCRMAALTKDGFDEMETQNFVGRAIRKLSRQGIYLRDNSVDMLIGRIVDRLAINASNGSKPIGHEDALFKGRTIGLGSNHLQRYEVHGVIHRHLKSVIHQEQATISAITRSAFWKPPGRRPERISEKRIVEAAQDAIEQLNDDLRAANTFIEWRWSENDHNPWTSPNWKVQEASVPDNIGDPCRNDNWLQQASEYNIESRRLSWEDPRDEQILRMAGAIDGKVIVTIDSGHMSENLDLPKESASLHQTLEPGDEEDGGITTAAAVILRKTSPVWDHSDNLEATPVYVRIMILPQRMGFESTDNNHGEALALCVAEEMLPIETTAFIVGDSAAARTLYRRIRDGETRIHDRRAIRKTLPGISKSIAIRLENSVLKWSKKKQSAKATPMCAASVLLASILAKRFVSDDPERPWPEEYWDEHLHRAIVKVDSHQVNPLGRKLSRYDQLAPCWFLVAVNQIADNAASFGLNKLPGATRPQQFEQMDNITCPDGLRFQIRWCGKTVDRETSKSLWKIFDSEVVRRAQKKPSQGLWMRARPFFASASRLIEDTGMHRGLVLRLKHSHTRALYKDEDYRDAIITRYDKDVTTTAMDEARDSNGLAQRHRLCPLCGLGVGNMPHLHQFCTDSGISTAREGILWHLEMAAEALLSEIELTFNTEYRAGIIQDLQLRLRHLELRSRGSMCKHINKMKITQPITNVSVRTQTEMDELQSGDGYPWWGEWSIRWPSICQLRLLTTASDGEIADSVASAMDITYLGVLPDVYYQWIDDICKDARKCTKDYGENAIKQAWKRVAALFFYKTNILQRIIRDRVKDFKDEITAEEVTEVEENEKREEDQAGETGATIKKTAGDLAQSMSTDNAEVRARSDSTDQYRTELKTLATTEECTATGCVIRRTTGEDLRVGFIRSGTKQCPKCTQFQKEIQRAQALERRLYNSRIDRTLFIAETRATTKKHMLWAIAELAHITVDNDSIWPNPTERSKGRYALNVYLRNAAQRIADTCLLVTDCDRAAPMPTLANREATRKEATTLCNCKRLEEISPQAQYPTLCKHCGHLQRVHREDKEANGDGMDACLTCDDTEIETQMNIPCGACVLLWLLTAFSVALKPSL